MITRSLFVPFIIFLTTTKVFAQNDKSGLISAYLQEAHQSGLFNGNILVADKGTVVIKKAIGYADGSKQVPLTTNYRFHIGSIAKEFDAVGIMLLQEQGKLTIDDKLITLFPDLPSWAKKISIKNLLQYTSGLPEIKWQTVHSDADNWKNLYAIRQLDFEPGSDYAYNNNNTFLRRRIIEKVTGISFNQFVLQKLLPVAGIINGLVDPTDKDPLIAKSFNDDFKQDDLAVPISGWTCLNLDDFYRWSQCIAQFCLITPESTQAIITPVGADKQCGLGGGSMKDHEVITHVHDGSALHYQALELTDTRKGRTIIILSNQRKGNVYDIANAIQAILDGKPYQSLSEVNSE
jgi:CubicO group peptidase (beta-lactamase class C family)